ncbi:hypothetical protein EJ065_2775 [Corallococcus coralloides]|uniref:Uncharacterized protein n=1 Tax=Corallococcus coralloides TaxID=184914 RepID=A0A410RR33_CORCK|nr:hypothetical protein EJ065_2775 [Corallococcus coralloides]
MTSQGRSATAHPTGNVVHDAAAWERSTAWSLTVTPPGFAPAENVP